ncbi:GNAT family N-acetyltransferase [Povalibacter sp.]|uniref:GNAT family N-acetyltransferase n=1 Tax=Povalibacter sp. TaxID=1962978 RepID=UPI002F40518A
MALIFLPARTEEAIAAIATMARTIWYEYYVPLIGRAQVDYMVARFQSTEAMQQQVLEGYEYFTVQREVAPIGYVAIKADDDGGLFISKLYLLREARGGGTGRAIMAFIEEGARQRGLGRLWLTVNKGNPAVKAYERLGFRIAAPIVMDIGGGFVMDDFRMEKVLE